MQRLDARRQEKEQNALVDRLFRRLEHRDSDSDDEDAADEFFRSVNEHRRQRVLTQPEADEESIVVSRGKHSTTHMKRERAQMSVAWQRANKAAAAPTLASVAAAASAAQRQQRRRPELPSMVGSVAASAVAPAAAPSAAPIVDGLGGGESGSAVAVAGSVLTPWTAGGVVGIDPPQQLTQPQTQKPQQKKQLKKQQKQQQKQQQQQPPWRALKRPPQGSVKVKGAGRPSSARPSSASSASSNGSSKQPQPPSEKRHRGSHRRAMSARPALQRKKTSPAKDQPRAPLRTRAGNSTARTAAVPVASQRRQPVQPRKQVRSKPNMGPGGRIDTGRKGEDLGKRMEMKRLQQVWKRVDADGSGTLDHGEVKAIFVEMGKTLSQREFMRAVDQIDSDGSGEVDFKEFAAYWDRSMTAAGVVVPSTFKFKSLCVRGILKSEAEGGWGEHHWIADDIANILFTSLGESSTKAHPRRPGELIGEQAKLLQDLWTAFDADGSGKLEQDEVQKVIEAAMERILTESELTVAFQAMDEDGSGEIDFHEFTSWWVKQGDGVKNRVMLKAFEETMASLGSEDISTVVIDTAAGPEQVRLVSPRGLFRLVIRSKSGHCREFHEWVQTIKTTTRNERGQRRKCVFNVPDVAALTKDFVLRNILVTTKNKDGWLFHKTEAVGVKASVLGVTGCELKVFTMPQLLPHKPNLLCVKGYTTIAGMTPTEVDKRLRDPLSRAQWDLLSADMQVLKTMHDGDAMVTQSFYDFRFPFHPSPIPTTELVLAHTRRLDTDGTIIHAAGTGAYDGVIKPRGKTSAVAGEVYCSGLIIAPARKGTATKLTVMVCIQPGAGTQIPVVAQRLFKDFFVSDQIEKIYNFLLD